jgi:hypothetical protein
MLTKKSQSLKQYFIMIIICINLIGNFGRANMENCSTLLSSASPIVSIQNQKLNDLKLISNYLESTQIRSVIQKMIQKWPSSKTGIIQLKFKKIPDDKKSSFNTILKPAHVFLLFLLVYPTISLSQQSLFNAPSIESTDLGQFFFQEQINLIPQEGVSNTTIDYGLGSGWSVGLSVFNLKLTRAQETNYVDPDILINIEKTKFITPNWKIGIGTQSGINSGHNADRKIDYKSFSYLQNKLILPEGNGSIYAGYYHANPAFTGDKSADGAMIGVEFPIIRDKLIVMGDYLSGSSPISVGVLGLVWITDSQWQISAGAQIPSSLEPNDFGVVLEFTKPTL